MPSEIRNGEKPIVTSFVGASAMPSHAPAASPHITPRKCSECVDRCAVAAVALIEHHQQADAERQHSHRYPELNIRKNRVNE